MNQPKSFSIEIKDAVKQSLVQRVARKKSGQGAYKVRISSGGQQSTIFDEIVSKSQHLLRKFQCKLYRTARCSCKLSRAYSSGFTILRPACLLNDSKSFPKLAKNELTIRISVQTENGLGGLVCLKTIKNFPTNVLANSNAISASEDWNDLVHSQSLSVFAVPACKSIQRGKKTFSKDDKHRGER